jgi:hypothetical protein
MKRLLATATVAAALVGFGSTAVAQYRAPPPGGGYGIQLRQRADQLEQRIRRGMNDGSLDRREADRSLRELADIRRMEDDLLRRGRGVLGPADSNRVSARLDQLERGIRWARNNDRVAPGYAGPPGPPPAGFRYGYGREFWNGAPRDIDQRLAWLETRLRRGMQDGSVTRNEANRAFRMLRDFRRREAVLTARDGGRLSGRSEARLNARLDEISQRIRWLRTNERRD